MLFATILFARLAPSLHTKGNQQTRVGFARTTRRWITEWCTEYPNSVVGSGVCHCTPQQLTSRKLSTASSILPCGHRSSTTASNPHMWNFCNGSTANKKGTVLTDTESDLFSIKRGTKQGDPLSSLLFIRVLQVSLEDDLKRWQEKQKGII